MNEFQPKVSIVIPVYNGSDYLREAVDSALAQTYQNREILVVNDGSSDGGKTEAVARSYGGSIRYIAKENGGVGSALNAGIRSMTGEYFSWLSHDDVYLPEKLEVQVDTLRKYTDPVVLYGDFYLIDGASRLRGRTAVRHVSRSCFLYALLMSSPVNGCTTLIPRLCFDDVGFFDERLRTTQDYDMWARLSKKYQFVHIPKALVKYRFHPGQGTRKLSNVQYNEANDFYIHCLNSFSADDLFGPGKLPAAISYLGLAAGFKVRGFTAAFQHALSLALDRSSGSSAGFLRRFLVSFVRSGPKFLLPQYWMFLSGILLDYSTALLRWFREDTLPSLSSRKQPL